MASASRLFANSGAQTIEVVRTPAFWAASFFCFRIGVSSLGLRAAFVLEHLLVGVVCCVFIFKSVCGQGLRDSFILELGCQCWDCIVLLF